MSLLDRHPAPWTDNGDSIVDANGVQVLFHPSMLGCASSLIIDLQAELAATREEWFRSNRELAAARAENEQLREALQNVLEIPYGSGSKQIQEAAWKLLDDGLRAKEGEK